jgi:hypothetical protein
MILDSNRFCVIVPVCQLCTVTFASDSTAFPGG